MEEVNLENKNPKNNIGAIWNKEGSKGDYLLMKITLNGENHTIVAFKNTNKKGLKTSKIPDYYLFPFKAKNSA